MRRGLLGLTVVCAITALAQGPATTQPPGKPVRPIGVVTQLQPGRFTLHTDAGPDVLILLSDGVSVLRVPPGAKDLNTASKINLGDVNSGDRVLVRGRVSDDQKSIVATVVMVMTKVDLAGAREAESLDWQRRGIGGTVIAVNAENKEITVSVPAITPTPRNPTHPVILALAANPVLLRYAPDSVKFSDAKPSAIEEIKVGDQVRALGTRSQDGTRFTAEKVVSGSFRNLGAAVVSVDTQMRSIAVKDIASGQTVLVRTNDDTRLHRLPSALAHMLAAPSSDGTPSNLPQMIESAPIVALGDLKPGDRLIVVSTEGLNPSQVVAIMVLSGVEPILEARPKDSNQMVPGSWNLGMGGSEGTP
jgi:hypothetical protein